jgi:hypothetical protein
MNDSEIYMRCERLYALLAVQGDPGNAQKRQSEVATLSRELALAYAERRGWTIATSPFPVSSLAGRKARHAEQDGLFSEFIDHPYYFARSDHPVAIVSHIYNCDLDHQEATRQWAAEMGLSVSFPTDFLSWHFPGMATLVEFTALDQPGSLT